MDDPQHARQSRPVRNVERKREPSPRAHELARVLADYHLMHHSLRPADCIVVLGSNDPRVAERGAELYRDGLAPLVLCSGDEGQLTKGMYGAPEGEMFGRICRARGVPASALLVEKRARNSGENARHSRDLLEGLGLRPQALILVQKPYMERRAYATFKKVWPGPTIMVTSPQVPYEEYSTPQVSAARIIHIIVGDLQRLALYPKRGFQIEQEIPATVWSAYEALVAMGFTEHLAEEC